MFGVSICFKEINNFIQHWHIILKKDNKVIIFKKKNLFLSFLFIKESPKSIKQYNHYNY